MTRAFCITCNLCPKSIMPGFCFKLHTTRNRILKHAKMLKKGSGSGGDEPVQNLLFFPSLNVFFERPFFLFHCFFSLEDPTSSSAALRLVVISDQCFFERWPLLILRYVSLLKSINTSTSLMLPVCKHWGGWIVMGEEEEVPHPLSPCNN